MTRIFKCFPTFLSKGSLHSSSCRLLIMLNICRFLLNQRTNLVSWLLIQSPMNCCITRRNLRPLYVFERSNFSLLFFSQVTWCFVACSMYFSPKQFLITSFFSSFLVINSIYRSLNCISLWFSFFKKNFR